jgi:TolB-like protein
VQRVHGQLFGHEHAPGRVSGFRRVPVAVLAAAALAAAVASGPSAQESRPVVMVVSLAVAAGWPAASDVVTDRIIARLREDGSARVLSRSETRAVLEAARLETTGVLDVQDVSRVARQAGADYVLMGEVEQFDQNSTRVCAPVVGCAYTVSATVRIRGLVVDAGAAAVVAHPEAQASGNQWSASVSAGPWWSNVTVGNFDAQLIGRVTIDAVGQFVTRVRPHLRPKPGRPGEPQPAAPTPAPAPSPGGQDGQ